MPDISFTIDEKRTITYVGGVIVSGSFAITYSGSANYAVFAITFQSSGPQVRIRNRWTLPQIKDYGRVGTIEDHNIPPRDKRK